MIVFIRLSCLRALGQSGNSITIFDDDDDDSVFLFSILSFAFILCFLSDAFGFLAL